MERGNNILGHENKENKGRKNTSEAFYSQILKSYLDIQSLKLVIRIKIRVSIVLKLLVPPKIAFFHLDKGDFTKKRRKKGPCKAYDIGFLANMPNFLLI